MALPRSPVPTRLPAGSSTDPPYGPLADSGYCNPFFYHTFADDFDNMVNGTGLYTITAASGSVAVTSGDGGLALFTTGATANQFAEIQVPAAGFTLPQGATAGKKLFWLCRLQLADVTNTAFILGLIGVNVTPFTAVNDGIYFSKAAGGTVLNINSAISSTITTTAVPASTYSLANATNIDLAFYIDYYGNLNVFVSTNMVGYVPQSGTGSAAPQRGQVLRVSNLTLTTVNLTPTLAIQTSGGAKTASVDFHLAMKER